MSTSPIASTVSFAALSPVLSTPLVWKNDPQTWAEITLTDEEVATATRIGNSRYNISRERGFKHKAFDGGASTDIEAAKAELAFSKHLGLVGWVPSVNTFGKPDIYDATGVGWQIKSTHHARGYLAIYPTANDDEPYVLIIGSGSKWKVAGWIYAKEGKLVSNEQKNKNGSTYYGAPCTTLRPMSQRPAPVNTNFEN